MGAGPQFGDEFGHHCRGEFRPPCPAGDIAQPLVARPGPGGVQAGGNHGLAARLADLLVGTNVKPDDAFLQAAQERQRAVRRHARPFLGVVEVVGELGAVFFLAGNHFRGHHSFLPEICTQVPQKIGFLRKLLGEDVAGTVQRFLHVGHAFAQVGRCECLRILVAVCEDHVAQRLEPLFPGDHRLGAALWLVGQIDVLEAGLGLGLVDGPAQRVGELVLLANGPEDGVAPVVELAHVCETFGQGAQLGVVEPAGDLLAVARDERDGRALVEKLDRG